MGLFDIFKLPNINQGIKDYQMTPQAVLLDVRMPSEYSHGHIPGSLNIPLPNIDTAATVVPDKSTPLFVYCYSGARSRQAAALLRQMGYSNVQNLGGINRYLGKVEQ